MVRSRSGTKCFFCLLLALVSIASLLLSASPALAQPLADLSIKKTDHPDPVTVGELLTYRLDVANQGPNAATGVVVTDVLPSSVRLVGVPPGCSAAGNTVTCTVGSLDIDDSFFVFLSVVPKEPGVITDTATVSSVTPDPNPFNNTATETTRVIEATASQRPAGNVSQISQEFDQEAESGNVDLGFDVSN